MNNRRRIIIIYSVNYEELSEQIDPFVFERYLKRNGWIPFEIKRDDIAIYQYIKDDQFEQVTIPNDRTLFDYSMALYQAVRTVANVEGRPIEEMLLTLLSSHSDIVKIRIIDLFYSESNVQYLEEIMQDIKDGKANFAVHDLIEVD